MTSLIDTQPATIQQLSVPICDGATTGSPSLIPYVSSLCYDYTTPGVLYTGTGVVWKNVGLSNIDDLVISNITLTNAGQPDLIIPKLSLQKITSGNVSMVTFATAPASGIAVAGLPATAVWSSAAGVIPVGFRSSASADVYLCSYRTSLFSSVPNLAYLGLEANGSILLYITGSPTFIQLQSISSNYLA